MRWFDAIFREIENAYAMWRAEKMDFMWIGEEEKETLAPISLCMEERRLFTSMNLDRMAAVHMSVCTRSHSHT